jgi:hypothetical protein
MKTDTELYVLEFSQMSKDRDMFPWHIQTQHEAYLKGPSALNWQIVFRGTYDECHREMNKRIASDKRKVKKGKFVLETFATIDETIFIRGHDLTIGMDYDDVDHKVVAKGAKKIVRLLNKHWEQPVTGKSSKKA